MSVPIDVILFYLYLISIIFLIAARIIKKTYLKYEKQERMSQLNIYSDFVINKNEYYGEEINDYINVLYDDLDRLPKKTKLNKNMSEVK